VCRFIGKQGILFSRSFSAQR